MATPRKIARNVRPANGAALLTSRDNRCLKEFRVALRGGLPTESGFVGVEGVRLVEEALRSGCPIRAVLFGESGERHRERLAPLIDRPEIAFPTLRTTDRLFEGLADSEHHRGSGGDPGPVGHFDAVRELHDRYPDTRLVLTHLGPDVKASDVPGITVPDDFDTLEF